MKTPRDVAAFLPWLLGVLFVAGIVHIVSVLSLPEVASKDAFTRLSAFGAPGQVTLLPVPAPGQELAPFEDPALAQGICLYDVSKAPLRVHADIEDEGLLTLSFRTRGGRIFYAMTDKATLHGKIDILVLTAAELDAVEANDDDDEPPQELRLISQSPTGFVLINALAEHPGDRDAAEARIRSVSCAPEPIAPN